MLLNETDQRKFSNDVLKNFNVSLIQKEMSTILRQTKHKKIYFAHKAQSINIVKSILKF